MQRPKSIAEARRRKGLTQQQLAEKVPMERAQLSRIESGHVQAPRLRVLVGLARVLRMPLAEVIRLNGLAFRNGHPS